MARFSGATVLLILVATVSVYTCAILAGGALGRALDRPTSTMTKQPPAGDSALRVSVSLRGLVEDFAKELWGGNNRQGRTVGGARPDPCCRSVVILTSSAARARVRHTQAELDYQAELEDYRRRNMLARTEAARSRRGMSRRDGVHNHEGGGAATATAMPLSSYTEPWGGYHRVEERSGGRAHAGAGDRAAASLPSSGGRASIPLSPAELQYHQRQAAYTCREISRSDGIHEGAAATTGGPVSRHNTFSSETELWGGGYHKEEGRSGGRAHDGASDTAAAALPLFAEQANLPVTGAELQYRERLLREGAGSLSAADRQILMRQIEAIRIEMLRQIGFHDEITEETRPGPWGVVKVGPWGGSGGEAFYMLGGGGGYKASRLESVTLYHADAVHALSFEYLLEGVGWRRAVGGGGPSSKGLRATINFSSDEQLTAVEGTFGHCRSVPEVVVTSLTLRTNKGRTYGPYGEETGTPFSIAAANGCIVGFWGRSRSLVDAIGVYIMPCQVNEPTS